MSCRASLVSRSVLKKHTRRFSVCIKAVNNMEYIAAINAYIESKELLKMGSISHRQHMTTLEKLKSLQKELQFHTERK